MEIVCNFILHVDATVWYASCASFAFCLYQLSHLLDAVVRHALGLPMLEDRS